MMPGKRLGQLRLGDDDHALLGHQQPALPVVVQVVADSGILRDSHFLVYNGPPDAAMPANLDAVEEEASIDVGIAIDADVGSEDAALNMATGNDASLADHAHVRLAPAVALAVDEFGRRHLWLVGTDRPVAIVEVQDR